MRGRKFQFQNNWRRNGRDPNQNDSIEEVLKLLKKLNWDSLNECHLNNEDLRSLLTKAKCLKKENIFELLNLINTFIENNKNSRSIKDIFVLLNECKFATETLQEIINTCFTTKLQNCEIKILLIFFTYYILECPKYFAENLIPLHCTLSMCSEEFQDDTIMNLRQRFIEARNHALEEIRNPPKNGFVPRVSHLQNCEAFRNISIVPQPDDIFCLNEEVMLLCNKFSDDLNSNKYESIDEYLSTQFRLLREDFIRPLRDSISKIRQNLLITNKLTARDIQVRIYENVEIEDLLPSRNGIMYKIKFDLSKFPVKMDWKKSRRFIHGSLLCFTNNLFDTMLFASVIESDPKYLSKGYVMVKFENDPISEILTRNQFMMIETKNLFEAYRHVLNKLQQFNLKTLPFSNYLAYAENSIENPNYMTNRHISNITVLNENNKDLDDSQLPALINSLKSNISLIQGPPGTGKTFLGLKIIKYLSTNFQNDFNSIGPILVVCYTNHALDQFLVEIIKELGSENVIRVGGRSKVESMKDCNVNNIKWQWVRKKQFPHALYKEGVKNRALLEQVEMNLVDLYIDITNLNNRLLTFSELQPYMNEKERRYFQKFDFKEWLKGAEILNENNFDLKKPRNAAILDIKTDLLDEYLKEFLNKLVEEILANLLSDSCTDEFDADVEDAETFLSNQRLLDEDLGIMKTVEKFKLLYSKRLINNIADQETIKNYPNEFKAVANLKLIKNKLKKLNPMTEENHKIIDDLNVDFEKRLQIYKYWFIKYQFDLIDQYHKLKVQYDRLALQKQNLLYQEYELIMKTKKVIGMTTTGAARYGQVLDAVGCKVVVIEEAAEVLEAHVISSLSVKCQQLIMIGDHKQLRPKVDVYDLEIKYNMGISLFERLIANNCIYYTLEYQHRMRPEISKCVKPIYPNLKDSDSVTNYASIPGMGTDIYFFNHSNFEDQTIDTSFKNEFEAQFVAEFCRYLLKCGNLAPKITVLTFYTGQLYAISKFMKSAIFKGIRICVVDNFQGEENDIIVLSLVRSNRNGTVGFLKSENRLCVALSRAKRGFYVIGNMIMLRKNIDILNSIVKDYYRNCIGSNMPLKCSLHPNDNNYFVKDIADFSKTCPSLCKMLLNCGHFCNKTCHLTNPSHKKYRCQEPCLKKCQRELHNCKLKCCVKCKCDEIISLILKCGHKTNIQCHINDDLVDCEVKCTNVLNCGHYCSENCSVDCVCRTMVDFKLKCNHIMQALCGSNIDEIKCTVLCNKTLDCGHYCTKMCYEKCDCRTIIKTIFNCRHEIKSECSKKPEKCVKQFKIKLLCGHTEIYFCGNESKIKCENKCGRKLECSHICQSLCKECSNILHLNCQEKCNKLLKCGHKCKNSCHFGSCSPCLNQCKFSCEHERCELKCFEICTKQSCSRSCTKIIFCEICQKYKTCQRTCDESCSWACRNCYVDDVHYYRMEPCKCMIKKSECNPKIELLSNELNLQCQNCSAKLATPYKGFILKYYNTHCKIYFRLLPVSQYEKFVDIFKKMKVIDAIDDVTSTEILMKISKYQTFESNFEIFDKSYNYFLEILDIYYQLSKFKDNTKLIVYIEYGIQILKRLIKWLDPTIRQYNNKEISLYHVEKNFVCLISEIVQFVYTASPNEYAMIFKNSFSLLDEMQEIFGEIPIEIFQEKFKEIKGSINKNISVSKEEEEIVKRVNDASNILEEFHIENKPRDEQLKLIKDLIKKCHPDKNKSTKSSQAFRLLNELKEKLQEKKKNNNS